MFCLTCQSARFGGKVFALANDGQYDIKTEVAAIELLAAISLSEIDSCRQVGYRFRVSCYSLSATLMDESIQHEESLPHLLQLSCIDALHHLFLLCVCMKERAD